ncbi:hypothetical protein [Thermoflavimicrobium dichotomicum]|uniref:Uncharacterized protein n=1 Tax=Thermoflavimicrobium dichotomicum TaxID=46223 RepID=A0A1I3U3H4_9BACL|nr:hypothetical protein [Thermoflavimicrobium dichotomicum]SFJ78074.1 hypothetical protein SAMN05421852_1223 [Thermoflavimicrobium dichotomicum]
MFLFSQPWWYTWDGIAAVGQWVGGLGSIAAIGAVYWQVRRNEKLSREMLQEQINENKRLAEENKQLILKQIEEQRKISEEEREPKISIHIAIKEKEVEEEKKRILIVTATNIGNVPVYITECNIEEKGSPYWNIYVEYLEFRGIRNEINKHNSVEVYFRSRDRSRCLENNMKSNIPNSLLPGEEVTVEINLAPFEMELIEEIWRSLPEDDIFYKSGLPELPSDFKESSLFKAIAEKYKKVNSNFLNPVDEKVTTIDISFKESSGKFLFTETVGIVKGSGKISYYWDNVKSASYFIFPALGIIMKHLDMIKHLNEILEKDNIEGEDD